MFISAAEFEEMQRVKAFVRRSRAAVGLSKAQIGQMPAGRMSAEHDRLDALLDEA